MPASSSSNTLVKSITDAGGRVKSLKAITRENSVSGVASIKVINQLPKPPIRTGITKKKTIVNA